MTDDRLLPNDDPPAGADPVQLEADRRHGADALATLTDALPRAEFRARLRNGFIAGELPESVTARELRVVPPSGATTTPRSASPRPRPRPAGRRWRSLAPLAAAAALLIVMALDRAPAWHVTAVNGDGVAVIDQQPIPLTHGDQLSAALHPGARVRVPDGAEIEIMAGRALAVRMLSGTDAIVPPAPSRWLKRHVTARIDHGQWRITTGPAFAGAQLEIETPHADVMVTGTTLSVICEPQGTCVCVFEGHVRVGHTPSDLVMVEHGHLRYMWADGGEPKSADIRPVEEQELGRFRREMQARLDRAR